MGGKIYNIQLNSSLATAVSTTSLAGYSKMQYNIDWANLLPDKKFKLTFAMMSAISFGLNVNFPYITTNLLGHSYQPATNGFQNAYYLGHLRQNTALNAVVANSTYVYSTYTADVNENTPIYLDNRPANNNLIVSILYNNSTSNEFTDTYATIVPGGTMTQTGFIITVQTFTSGVLTVGSVITPTSQPARTITGFITGFGNIGLYLCNVSQAIATGTGFTANADTTPFGFPQYILNLSFEELD